MYIAWLPYSICEQIDKYAHSFLWNGNQDKGVHLVGLYKIPRLRKVGGLGIRRAHESNTAMLGKLVWDIHCNSYKLWVCLLRHKFVNDKFFLDMPTTLGATIWNSIMKAKETLRNGFDYKLEDGSSSFWYAPWTKFGKLCEKVLYVDTHDVHLTIADVVQDDVGTRVFHKSPIEF